MKEAIKILWVCVVVMFVCLICLVGCQTDASSDIPLEDRLFKVAQGYSSGYDANYWLNHQANWGTITTYTYTQLLSIIDSVGLNSTDKANVMSNVNSMSVNYVWCYVYYGYVYQVLRVK